MMWPVYVFQQVLDGSWGLLHRGTISVRLWQCLWIASTIVVHWQSAIKTSTSQEYFHYFIFIRTGALIRKIPFPASGFLQQHVFQLPLKSHLLLSVCFYYPCNERVPFVSHPPPEVTCNAFSAVSHLKCGLSPLCQHPAPYWIRIRQEAMATGDRQTRNNNNSSDRYKDGSLCSWFYIFFIM